MTVAIRYSIFSSLATAAALFIGSSISAQSGSSGEDEYVETQELVVETVRVLPVSGKVVHDKERIEGAEVKVVKDNEPVEAYVTEKSGRFSLELELGSVYMIEVAKEGFITKRFVVNAKDKAPKADERFEGLNLDVVMLDTERFREVDADVLDFPFAFFKYDSKLGVFTHDPEYTTSMQRASAAVMLMSARAVKRSE